MMTQAQTGGVSWSFYAAGGINFSDINYGNDIVKETLPVGDYTGVSIAGDGAYGYQYKIGTSHPIFLNTTLAADIGFAQLGYRVNGFVENINPALLRPLSPDVPTSIDGQIDYRFVTYRLGVRRKFGFDTNEGFILALATEHWMHLNTKWNMDVVFETTDTGVFNDFEEEANDPTDYNDLTWISLGAGYQFPLGANFSVIILPDVKLGLNAIEDNTVNPIQFGGNVVLNFSL